MTFCTVGMGSAATAHPCGEPATHLVIWGEADSVAHPACADHVDEALGDGARCFPICRFSFNGDGEAVYSGVAHGTTWNGFDNVSVTPEVRDLIAADFKVGGAEAEEVDDILALPIANGLVSFAGGYTCVIERDEEPTTPVAELPVRDAFTRSIALGLEFMVDNVDTDAQAHPYRALLSVLRERSVCDLLADLAEAAEHVANIHPSAELSDAAMAMREAAKAVAS